MSKVVYVVDDDDGVRALLSALLLSVSIPTREFASGVEFLRVVNRSFDGCVLLDVRMPQISGLEVCEQLRQRGIQLPVVLMSGFADVPMVIRAMKVGAIDFVQKPFNSQDVLERIQHALASTEIRSMPGGEAVQYLDALTPRERQVLELAVTGKLNKEIAAELGIGQRTVETHRAKMMKKMACRSMVELMRKLHR